MNDERDVIIRAADRLAHAVRADLIATYRAFSKGTPVPDHVAKELVDAQTAYAAMRGDVVSETGAPQWTRPPVICGQAYLANHATLGPGEHTVTFHLTEAATIDRLYLDGVEVPAHWMDSLDALTTAVLAALEQSTPGDDVWEFDHEADPAELAANLRSALAPFLRGWSS